MCACLLIVFREFSFAMLLLTEVEIIAFFFSLIFFYYVQCLV